MLAAKQNICRGDSKPFCEAYMIAGDWYVLNFNQDETEKCFVVDGQPMIPQNFFEEKTVLFIPYVKEDGHFVTTGDFERVFKVY